MVADTKHTDWYLSADPWILAQTARNHERNIYFETVLSQANGHMGVRAYTEERTGAESFREGYLAGVFSHLGPEATKLVGPREFPVSEMVTMPEIFACEITLAGESFNPDTGTIDGFKRTLDMRTGELRRTLTWTSPEGRQTKLCFERFLFAAHCALACHRISLTALNWDGEAVINWQMDGTLPTLVRFGAKSFTQHPQDHLSVVATEAEGNAGLLHLKTRGTEHDIAVAASVTKPADCETEFPQGHHFRQQLTLDLKQSTTVVAERCVAVVTSRDRLEGRTALDTARTLVDTSASLGYNECLAQSRAVWQKRWELADIRIDGPARDQKIIRYNLFQLLQMAPWDSDRMSLVARALAFNRYRGTYFWDTETFILPFYSVVFPEVAQNLLSFRHNTLDGARETAAHYNEKGALYPWMTEADDGADHSLFRLTDHLWHQTADIAYAVDEFARIGNNIEFMAEKGLEILIETARFCTSAGSALLFAFIRLWSWPLNTAQTCWGKEPRMARLYCRC